MNSKAISSPFQDYVFGSYDGTELEFLLPLSDSPTLIFEIHGTTHMHLGRFQLLDSSGWRTISRDDIVDFVLSSDIAINRGGSLEAMLSSSKGFFETINQENPWCRLTLASGRGFCGIRVHNRPFVLWHRALGLRIGISRRGETRWIFDAGDNMSIASYVQTRVIHALALALATEQCLLGSLEPLFRAGLNLVKTINIYDVFSSVTLAEKIDYFIEVALDWLYFINEISSGAHEIARVSIMLSGLRRQIAEYSETHVLKEFLLRLRIFPRDVAFWSIRSAQSELINNQLYGLISSALVADSTKKAVGSWRLSGHGLFADHSVRTLVPANITVSTLAGFARLQEQFNNAGYKVLLCYGALLGLIRDGALMAHDDDVDALMILDNADGIDTAIAKIRSIIGSEPSSIVLQSTNTEGLVFLSISGLRDISGGLDIFFGWPELGVGDRFMLPMEKVKYRSIPIDIIGSGIRRELAGSFITIPADPERFFGERYGSKWETPDFFYRLREG